MNIESFSSACFLVPSPIQSRESNSLGEGPLEVFDQLIHALLGFRLKVLFDVQLADELAQDASGHVDAALPQRFLLGRRR